MTCFTEMLTALRADRRGATAIEYGLIAALICIAAIGGYSNFGDGLSQMWNNVSDAVDG